MAAANNFVRPPAVLLLPFLAVVVSLLLLSKSEASEFVVGGKESVWKIPSSPDEFNKWAQSLRFQIGDSLVLKYDGKADSVLQVTEEDYNGCNTASPMRSYDDGNTTIVLDRSGPFFFISGTAGHCDMGQKVVVDVLSPMHSSKDLPQAPAPALAPHTSDGLPAAPGPSSLANDAPYMRCGVVLGAVMVLASLFGLPLP